ncbi:hypothetical protein HBH44_206540 [Parastagonospora nodorum]|nr:hypothetical protein HBH54_221980 [Parastagonospora nodorum]KAH4126621.1 hypothetical protein HBH45_222040 [Parastagonospora nodorum]KAH4148681.1 hypothetical protein HBH44_206540 [Parastagonospora nodorum]KAH4557242.1 hypothetical protein HBH84_225380 [Parastagonospora nodorum]KAH4616489.1 hypothetical protein HBH55_205800 [Parastagonospora nodorum]
MPKAWPCRHCGWLNPPMPNNAMCVRCGTDDAWRKLALEFDKKFDDDDDDDKGPRWNWDAWPGGAPGPRHRLALRGPAPPFFKYD